MLDPVVDEVVDPVVDEVLDPVVDEVTDTVGDVAETLDDVLCALPLFGCS